MTVSYTVGPKGQIVVAKEIRERLGVKPGFIASQRLVDGHLEMRFIPPPHRRSLAGSLAHYVNTENRITPENWDRVREDAWASGWREKSESEARRVSGLLDTSLLIRYFTDDPPGSAAMAARVLDGHRGLSATRRRRRRERVRPLVELQNAPRRGRGPPRRPAWTKENIKPLGFGRTLRSRRWSFVARHEGSPSLMP